MRLRAPDTLWRPFVAAICARTDVETAGILLAQVLPHTEVLVVRHASVVPDDAYLIRERDRLRLDPIAINRLVRPARDHGWGVFTVHSHPETDAPWFSIADDLGDERLMASLQHQMDGPHGSIVAAGNTLEVAGRSWSREGRWTPLEVRVIGSTIDRQCRASSADGPAAQEWYHRQCLALGDAGHRALRSTHIGVVGLGGTGSAAAVQLAHLGVGELTLVDADIVEATNVSRVIGCTTGDAGETTKVDVATRYIQQLGLGTRVAACRGHLGDAVPPSRLAGCDVILSCVDTHTPRALLNRLAYNALVPVVDLGSAFRVRGDGTVSHGAGRVVVIGPGKPCLACWGHIDPDRLREEALSADDRARLAHDGYIDGAEVAQPSVVAFNTAVAASAVIEVLRLVTGFAGTDGPPTGLSFDFIEGTVRRSCVAGDGRCRICGAFLRCASSTGSDT